MTIKSIFVTISLGGALTAQITRNHDVALKNWPTPLYWQPSHVETEAARTRLDPAVRPPIPEAATPAGSLVFVAMTPCRVVDTRISSAFPSPFGMPALVANATRSFPIQSSTLCTIPATAQAYSFNVTVVPNPLGTPVGYLTIWNTAGPPNTPPNAVTLDDFPTGDIRNNAAIVPAGITNGSVSAITNANTDLVIDINGYFAPSTGITLAQGTAAAPSLSFSGDAGTGIFSSAGGNLNFTAGGANALTVRPDQDLDLVGNIRKGGSLFLHNLGADNTAVGINALSANTGGSSNTAIGFQALRNNTTGINNTASGLHALFNNTTGFQNTTTGLNSLLSNTTGGNNTAIGIQALALNTTGGNNTALGNSAGLSITTGSNNIDIGNQGTSMDSGIIRIGTAQTAFFAAGISGVMTGGAGSTVLIDANGQLGTVSSSRRFKEDIQSMEDASSGLLRLRPVTYRYQQPYADGSKPIDYGLIAEEVAEVYPDLVVKGADGRIETVQYHKLVPMLVNELQKQEARIEVLQQEHETTLSLQSQVAALQKAVKTLMSGKAQGAPAVEQ